MPISRSRHFEIESEALVGRNPEVKVNNNDLDYQSRAATAILILQMSKNGPMKDVESHELFC